MITGIEIEGFKSLEKVHLKLGKFNLFIGANASGKSNFFDALKVLQGIGYGFTVDEIFNGKPESSTGKVWDGIRGGSSKAKFVRPYSALPLAGDIFIQAEFRTRSLTEEFFYQIRVEPELGLVTSEVMARGGDDGRYLYRDKEAFSATDDEGDVEGDVRHAFKGRPLFVQNASEQEISCLTNMQNLAPVPSILRRYGQRSLADRMGDSGEDFASLVRSILHTDSDKAAYLAWLQQLVPFEAEEVKILSGALGEPLFALKKGGIEFPAPVLSDGTLRFAALAAAFFQPAIPDILTIEDIEDGVHPGRLRLLLELLKSQSSGDGPQVFATTHSPVILAWLEESDYETTFFCKRDEETGASIIRPLSKIPRLVDLVKNSSLGELFTEGWMEGAF